MMDNKPLAVDTGRGFSINYKGKSLYSRYNPQATPVKVASSVTMEEDTLYILPSPLLMYGVEELCAQLPESSYILGIEADQSLMAVSAEPASQFSTSQFQLVRLDSREQLKSMIDRLGIWKFRRCRQIALNSGYNLNRELYDYLYQFASFALSTFWRNRLTIHKLGGLWIENVLNNIPMIQRELPNNNDKPVIICGAGPSLDSTLDLMKKYRDRVYIMCVDTALSTLLEEELIPDLVFALEAQFYNLWDFHNSGQYSFDLLADITSYPPICRMNKGNLFFSFTDFQKNKLTDRLIEAGIAQLRLPPLGSVGVAALSAALQVFNSNIYLTGLDFAYTPGKSHSKGSPFVKTILEKTNRVKSVDSVSSDTGRQLIPMPGKREGSTITTDSVLQTYGNLIRDILSQETNVFDLTTEGFPLGIPYVSPSDFDEVISRGFENKSVIEQDDSRTFHSQDFLLNEKELLESVITLWDIFNESDEEKIPDELMKALELADYIYIDFPDKLPHPRHEIAFVSRAVKSARKYLAFIDMILKREF